MRNARMKILIILSKLIVYSYKERQGICGDWRRSLRWGDGCRGSRGDHPIKTPYLEWTAAGSIAVNSLPVAVDRYDILVYRGIQQPNLLCKTH